MKTDINFYQNKNEYRLLVKQSYSSLIKLKNEGDKKAFNDLVLKILPTLRNYINRGLRVFISKGNFSKGKYKADDIIDQLFIEIFDHIEEVEKADAFYAWLYLKIDALMDDIQVEEEFNDFFFKNIDAYSKPEWDEMQEKYSTDGDGDLMLIEELDDISYNHNDYDLNAVFIEDNEVAFINAIDKNLNQEIVNKHTALVLHNLPYAMRHVFELFTNEHLSLQEIAFIKKYSLTEVKELLHDAKQALQVSLFNRYLN
ncbi:sigma-70 family RNA polymerase sigma factor [Lacinutrix sp. C3R15]|uniref:RNA polymerase sigma factor n=1 Tax=Flavobacteriaceae TaxID=49546 RepID=UPI001C08A492|nr:MULTISPECIES: sigma-70 family RNA polymerase sigma factor [Flavobacteriaceae]MBU2939780.1 sigma-70 family RNA polymerase sigma factor [Lacinutrix sp. C3R15]MDO6623095.1 sigma-70 family RNA polymerase sigma factor [Oceanihabitans sp. 1_MG-2023]